MSIALLLLALPARGFTLGDLVVVDPAAPAVVAVDPATGARAPISTGGYIRAGQYGTGITFGQDGAIYVANGVEVFRVDPATGGQILVATQASGFTSVYGLAPLDATHLLAADALGAALKSIDVGSGMATNLASGGIINLPVGVAVGASGTGFAADTYGMQVLRIDAGGVAGVTQGGNLYGPHGITVGLGGALFVSDATLGKIVRVDPASGAQANVASGGQLVNPGGIVADPSGTLFVTIGGAVLRVDPSSGAQSVLASGFASTSGTDMSIALTRVLAACGNGVVESGEQCDDGNTRAGDCCSATCVLEPTGQACDDGDSETAGDTCSAGSCRGTTVASIPSITRQKVTCALADTGGSGVATCEVHGFAAGGGVTTRAAGSGTLEVLKSVRRKFGRRKSRVALELKLNGAGRKLLRQQGTLQVRVQVTVIDRAARTGILQRLVAFLRRGR